MYLKYLTIQIVAEFCCPGLCQNNTTIVLSHAKYTLPSGFNTSFSVGLLPVHQQNSPGKPRSNQFLILQSFIHWKHRNRLNQDIAGTSVKVLSPNLHQIPGQKSPLNLWTPLTDFLKEAQIEMSIQ
jgi:hypothetical protein